MIWGTERECASSNLCPSHEKYLVDMGEEEGQKGVKNELLEKSHTHANERATTASSHEENSPRQTEKFSGFESVDAASSQAQRSAWGESRRLEHASGASGATAQPRSIEGASSFGRSASLSSYNSPKLTTSRNGSDWWDFLCVQQAENEKQLTSLQRCTWQAPISGSCSEARQNLFRCLQQFQCCLSALMFALCQQPPNTEGILSLLLQQQRIGKLSEYIINHQLYPSPSMPDERHLWNANEAATQDSEPSAKRECEVGDDRRSLSTGFVDQGGDYSDHTDEDEPCKKDGGKLGRKLVRGRQRNPKPYLANTIHSCTMCKSNITPQWRYLEGKRFCNACYMRIKRHLTTKGIMVSGQKTDSRRRRARDHSGADLAVDWLDPVLDEVNKLRIVEEEVRKVRLGLSASDEPSVDGDDGGVSVNNSAQHSPLPSDGCSFYGVSGGQSVRSSSNGTDSLAATPTSYRSLSLARTQYEHCSTPVGGRMHGDSSTPLTHPRMREVLPSTPSPSPSPGGNDRASLIAKLSPTFGLKQPVIDFWESPLPEKNKGCIPAFVRLTPPLTGQGVAPYPVSSPVSALSSSSLFQRDNPDEISVSIGSPPPLPSVSALSATASNALPNSTVCPTDRNQMTGKRGRKEFEGAD